MALAHVDAVVTTMPFYGGAGNELTGQGGNDVRDGGRGDDTLLGDFAYQGDARLGMGAGYATLGPDATNNSIATAFDVSGNFSLVSDRDPGAPILVAKNLFSNFSEKPC